ncbi:MAG: stage IV sporulation protein A [Clostridiaceae bacterium]|nr:stage IV sporulation protein A [Clostridiaceae bacterium]
MERSIYESIAERTDKQIYIGIVGPVRTGKSTFIKSFMEELVLPNIDNVYQKERARDELPQSGSGRTIMTAEPKFVPEEAVKITIDESASLSVRMIDCVGYMVSGAIGQFEGDSPRMVSTPWFDYEIPLAEAAEIGTRKVITEHSTIGLVVTTDGSIGDIPRSDYIPAEERIIAELKEINKPFCILLNTTSPTSATAIELSAKLSVKYGVSCMPVNCMQLKKDDISSILKTVLYEFPAKEFAFTLPDWIGALPDDNKVKVGVYSSILTVCSQIVRMREVKEKMPQLNQCEYIESTKTSEIDLGEGIVSIAVTTPKALFYQIISEQSGIEVKGDGDLLPLLCQMAQIKEKYMRVEGALEQVIQTGYGIVMPTRDEMHLEKPELVNQGGRYGVKLRASAPSIHLIRADIETEVSPIVGSEKQSEDLVKYLLAEFEDSPEKIWESNIFGKSLCELVNEGLNNKLYKMPVDARGKLQETLQRIINEGSGGLICIIL